MTEVLLWKEAEMIADTTAEERHLQLVEGEQWPNTPEVQEIAHLANAYRDLMIARRIVEKRVDLLSVVPNEIQIQAREIAGKIPKVN